MPGMPGTQGPPGLQGRNGAKGQAGDKGEKGNDGPRGKSGPPGIKGTWGILGDQGIKGDKGEKAESVTSTSSAVPQTNWKQCVWKASEGKDSGKIKVREKLLIWVKLLLSPTADSEFGKDLCERESKLCQPKSEFMC